MVNVSFFHSTKPAEALQLPEHSVQLCGASLAPISETKCIETISKSLSQGQGGWCVTLNLENLRKTVNDPLLFQQIETSSLRVADGMPLVWAGKLQKTPFPERVCGSDLVHTLTAAAANAGYSVYLLGGNDGVAEQAAKALQEKHPHLKIAGIDCPPFGFEQDSAQKQAIANRLAAAQPDIIYVAVGFPKSELFIKEFKARCPNAWWLGVGISFSYVTQDIKRPPVWVQNLGMEFIFRMLQEPRRLGRRYLVDGPPFAMRLLLTALINRFRS